MTWALILSLIRKVPFAFEDVKQGKWNREAWQGTELYAKTLGIVGYGRVGRQIAKMVCGWGMKVIYYDINTPKHIMAVGVSLETLLRNSDIITVHVPLDTTTRLMFGAKEFAMMKPTAYFVNTSRGAVVDEAALWRALIEGKIKGAAIDVCRGEPHLWYPLQRYAEVNDNLIITPHISGNTAESRKKTQLYIANKILNYIKGSG
ncbi:MAG: NAD(P)-dependent oxidoreductase [Dehalococcoidia bacterium]